MSEGGVVRGEETVVVLPYEKELVRRGNYSQKVEL